MALFMEIKAADGLVSRTKLDAGNNRFTVRLGDSYRIVDDQTGLTPAGIAVKRVDNNLVVDGLDTRETTVEFAEFYSICSAGSPCELTVDSGSGSAPVAITPGTQPIGALADGAFVLYDPNFAQTAPAAPSMGDGTVLRNVLYGVGGLAVVGLAAGGGGGGGGGGGSGDGTRPDGLLKLTSSEVVNSRTPNVTGEGEPGARVIMRIDTDNDGTPNVTYATIVGADSTWSINLATAVPESGALPAGGLPDASNVGITSSTSSGNSNLPTFVLSFDGTPPAPAVINAIAADNVVNASEKTSGFVVSGTAEAGATVTVTLGQQIRSTVADAAGQWQTPAFDAASVPPDGAYAVTAVVQDRAGNNSAASQLNISVNTAPPVLNLDPVAGNSRVGAVEAASVAFQGDTDPNAAVNVLWNGLNKPVTANGSGGWSVSYAGAEVPNSAGQDFDYTITATSAVGNIATAAGKVFVDRVVPPAPAIATVAGDNIVNGPEKAAGVAVAGTAEAGATVQVNWGAQTASATVNGSGNWQAVFAAGSVPADGAYTLSAVTRDSADNESGATTLPVRISTAAPPLTVSSAAGGDFAVSAAEAARVEFSGSAAAGAVVNLLWNGITQSVAAGPTGNWATAFTGSQVPASAGALFSYTASSADAIGNIASLTGNVLVDTVRPAAPALVAVPPNTGAVAVNNSINLNEQTVTGFNVTGTAEAGTRVTVQLDVTPGVADAPVLATALVAAGGTWQTSYGPGVVPIGTASVLVNAFVTDSVGNVSASSTPLSIPVDATGATAPPQTVAAGSEVITADALFAVPASSGDGMAGSTISTSPFSASVVSLVPLENPSGQFA